MKKRLILTAVAVATIMGLNPVYAEMTGPDQDMMRELTGEKQPDPQSLKDFQESMSQRMMQKYGPGWEMMEGYGMGPGMMGYSGMGPGMMHRYGMRHGYGMGPGMMGGHGFCQGPVHLWNYQSEEFNTFMNETKETRKKLHDLQFEYSEMLRNPKTTIEELRNREKEMYELQQELRKKALKK